MLSEAEQLVLRLARTFDEIGIAYMIGGSVASSMHGFPRFTRDVDLVADIREEHISPLKTALQEEFYIDDEMIRDAITTQSSCSILQLSTMVKADIFVLKSDAWSQSEWGRRRQGRFEQAEETDIIYVATPEDMILQKLRWYRMGGEVSDNQWKDVQGMLKVQGDALDFTYLNHWAQELQLTDLLDRAYTEAGMSH
jgi:hypothetical protein